MKRGEKIVFTSMLIALLIVMVLSMMVGRYPIEPSQLWNIITGNAVDDVTKMVFFEVRLPRMIAAILIGAALSVSGASYQGILRNPMVAPDILGASSGASFGAALGILLECNSVTVQIMAFIGGLMAVGIAFFVSSSLKGSDRGSVLTLVLTGMVVTALFSAGISAIKYIGDPYDTLPALTFWLMGGLTYVTSDDIKLLLIPFLVGVLPLLLLRWKMNVLCFSDEEASAMGVDSKRVRAIIILCATLLTCSSVAVGGMIGWVGLIIPHICRMLTGPDYKKLLPVTVVAGALFLVIVDDVARCLSAQELPLGILTAMIGVPIFLVQLYKGGKSFI